MTEDILNLEKKSRLEKLALKIAHLERQKRAIQLRENQKAKESQSKAIDTDWSNHLKIFEFTRHYRTCRI